MSCYNSYYKLNKLIWESISTIKCCILMSDKDTGEEALMWQWKWWAPLASLAWGFSLTCIDCGAKQLRDSSWPATVFVTVGHTQRRILCVLQQSFSQRTSDLHWWEYGNNPACYHFLTSVDKLISKSKYKLSVKQQSCCVIYKALSVVKESSGSISLNNTKTCHLVGLLL